MTIALKSIPDLILDCSGFGGAEATGGQTQAGEGGQSPGQEAGERGEGGGQEEGRAGRLHAQGRGGKECVLLPLTGWRERLELKLLFN